MGGSQIWFKEGEELTVNDALKAIAVVSANDVCMAVSEHIGGSEQNFVKMMNEKAEQLGLSSTHFDNPHGLSSETHYTTAKELAVLSAYALRNETFRAIVSTKSYTIPERENCTARYFSPFSSRSAYFM